MAEGPPRVVMFEKSTAQAFYNSNFAATGRDHVTVNVAVGTAGQPPSNPIQESQSRARGSSLVSRFLRRFRRNTRRLCHCNHNQASQDAEVIPPSPTSATPPAHVVNSTPIRPSLPDVVALSNGSSLTCIDHPSQVPQPRPCASSEEEVYERSLLSKGHGHPMYNPSPLVEPVKLGDYGIITQDGFQSFGNLYAPNDQNKFPMDTPPAHDVIHKSEKFKEGQTFVVGMEDAKRPIVPDGINRRDATGVFEFHCREPQGAVLALTSSAKLETLSPRSRNELRQYLCDHGTRLMMRLCRNRYLDPGQSLYVVTGTIKSDSWGIAVHTSPMREPHDYVVLARRTGKDSDFLTDRYEWTHKGKADTRYEASTSVEVDGRRTKDQCLFLRGFLITPSPRLHRLSHQGDWDSPANNPNSDSDSSDTGDRKHGGSTKDGARKDLDSRGSGGSSSSTVSGSCQLHGISDLHRVLPFPTIRSKNYYPSQCINEMLLLNFGSDLAITHDDDWRHMVEDRFLNDDSLAALMKLVYDTTCQSICNGAATITPPVVLGLDSEPHFWTTSSSRMCIDGSAEQIVEDKGEGRVEEELKLEPVAEQALVPSEKREDPAQEPRLTGKRKALLIGIQFYPDPMAAEVQVPPLAPSTPSLPSSITSRAKANFTQTLRCTIRSPLASTSTVPLGLGRSEVSQQKQPVSKNTTKKGKEKERKSGHLPAQSTSTTQSTFLRGGHQDVEGMERILADLYGYSSRNIITMIDNPCNVASNSPLLPTRQNIIKQIQELVKGAVEGDQFFFFFAGQSEQEATNSLDKEDRRDKLIVTYDNNTIRDDELRQLLVAPLPPGVKLTAVFDVCHSASLLNLKHFRCNRSWVPWINKSRSRLTSNTAFCKPLYPLLFFDSKRTRREAEASDDIGAGGATDPGAGAKGGVPQLGETTEAEALERTQKQARGLDAVLRKPLANFPEGADTENGATANKENMQPKRPEPLKSQSRKIISVPKFDGWMKGSQDRMMWGGSGRSGRAASLGARHCISPEERVCTGKCREQYEREGVHGKDVMPFVISLSAATKQHTLYWDVSGASMTQHLIAILRNDPTPTLERLLTVISHDLHSTYLDINATALRYHNAAREVNNLKRRTLKVKVREVAAEMYDFQDPQVSSLWPLDMKREVWDP